ncbi:hypothetical protein Q7P35_000657 [Cladosporium inversicolor]
MSGNLHRPDPSVYLSWPTPNYIDPVRRSWMPAYAGTLQAASSLAVILRLYLRARKQAGPLGLDDVCTFYVTTNPTQLTSTKALLLPGWLGSIAFTVFTLLSTERYGSGTHTWDVPMTKFVPLAMMGWCAEVTYLASTGFTKCSILLFYRRLTKGTYNMRWKWGILVAIAVTAVYSLLFIFMLIFSCSPTAAYWESFNPYYQEDFHCIQTQYTNVMSGVMSIASDLYSVLLPCIMLRKFDAPRRQKIALNIIFSLGLIAVAAGSVRTYYLEKVGHSVDLTWDGYDVLVWAQLETQLSLICASAPALRVFFRTYLTNPLRVFSSARSDSRQNSRRESKRLPDESSDSSRGSVAIPLSSVTAGKPDNLTNLSEEHLVAESPAYSAQDKEFGTSPSECEDPIRDLEANRPPSVYSFREKQSVDVHPHGGYQCYPSVASRHQSMSPTSRL